jgi:hypothetical protein
MIHKNRIITRIIIRRNFVNITEINKNINDLESQFNIEKEELAQCKKLSDVSFAFAANWRDKASFAKRIPVLQEQLDVTSNKLNILRSERVIIEKQFQKDKEILDLKNKERIDRENKIVNPILLMDV